ncbi:MAG: transcriptional repressor [Pseudomonadota bacterium]|jgi:Fur family iron response transcriptional regulator|nr:transcriptional repressor [Gammaproteobacteria bacterium]MBR93010.1 transcriptional repressor [Pseudomonadota bacterium]GIS40258.1 MAG: transcriptional repressor [Pseudomonadota bacterium]|tara:strand:+ start:1374 stop:1790 length:417 start_codon:yes stop_codon:yes gene_type:complete
MDDVIELKSKVQEKLKLYGLRPTRARTRIGMILLDKPKHLSADQVHEKLKLKGYTISKATVYNTLNAFAKYGIVSEVTIDPSRTYYDSTTKAHHHFFNVDTGQLMDIASDDISVENIPRLPDNTQIQDLEIVVKISNK